MHGICPLAAVVAMVAGFASNASAADLCGRVVVPEELGLICRAAPDSTAASERTVISSGDDSLASLNRLALRQLSKTGDDETAWSDPDTWLQDQLVLDLDGINGAVSALVLDPDSPLADPAAKTAVEGALKVIRSWSRVALAGCEEVRASEDGRQIDCTWTAGPLALRLGIKLVALGDERYALDIVALNQQRYDHLAAIANSFKNAE